MPKPISTEVAALAVTLAKSTPPIPYTDMDCQRFVRHCITALGGTAAYRGSNDMYRNACTAIYPLAQAQAQNLLRPGQYLFIVEPQSATTPAAYQGDGLGDATHIGYYTGDPAAEAVHSSQSRGIVTATTLSAGWTHMGIPKDITFAQPAPAATPPADHTWVTVTTQSGGLNLRKTPGGAYMLSIEQGTRLLVEATKTHAGTPWAQVTHTRAGQPHTGWIDLTFTTPDTPSPRALLESAQALITQALEALTS